MSASLVGAAATGLAALVFAVFPALAVFAPVFPAGDPQAAKKAATPSMSATQLIRFIIFSF
jgi:hypothetical protein